MALKFLNDGYFAGKVGIGTESPSAKLHVNPTTTDEIAIAINGTQNYSAGEFQRIAAGDANSLDRLAIGFGYDSPTDWAIRYSSYGRHEFYTGNDWGNAANTEKMVITSSGNVGIGTASPGALLEISGIRENQIRLTSYDTTAAVDETIGGIEFYSSDAGNEGVKASISAIAANTEGSAYMTFSTGTNTEKMRIDSAGNVGIGKTPQARNVLDIQRNDTLGSFITHRNDTGFALNRTYADYGNDGDTVEYQERIGVDGNNSSIGNYSNHTLAIQTNNQNRITILSGGNVGIGTTSPDLKLDVTHATSGEYVATFQNTAANLELKLGVTSTNYLNIQGQEIGNSNAYNMSLQADGGNVGINTTIPTQKLHVSGNARVTGAYYDSNNSPGAANQVLVSTVTGTDWVDGSGSSIIGGPYLPLAGGTMTGTIIQNGGNIDFSDGRSANFGNGDDLQIYHDGSNSYINETGTGSLVVKTGALLVRNPSDASMLDAQSGGAINLYYNGSKKFETTNTGVAVTGDVVIDSALLSNQENTDVDTGTETVASVAIATYTAGFFDFVIKKTTNVRSGTVYACHDGTNVEFTETSTQDLGDTSDVTLSVDISGGNMRLLATVTSDDWSIKSLIRAI
jgi:hypothetical protein